MVEYCNAPRGTATLAHNTRPTANLTRWRSGSGALARVVGMRRQFEPEDTPPSSAFLAWVPRYRHPPRAGRVGTNGDDVEWTRRFFKKAAGRGLSDMWGWGLHSLFLEREWRRTPTGTRARATA